MLPLSYLCKDLGRCFLEHFTLTKTSRNPIGFQEANKQSNLQEQLI